MNNIKSSQDPVSALRNLANKWTLLARDYARDAKNGDPADPRTPYHRGLAEGYYKAAVELAEIVKQFPDTPNASAASYAPPAPTPTASAPVANASPRPAEPQPQAAPPSDYLNLSIGEVLNVLSYAGTNPRDVTPNKSVGTYTAVFSRWENLMPHDRIEMIKAADHRIVIVSSGKTRDNSDPYIEIAFKQSN